MSDLRVRIVDLEPMRWAGTAGFGPEPEGLAWDALLKWAEPIGLLSRPHRFFGYNNPDPSPGSPNYGYDVWVTVDESVQAEGDGRIIEFPGGLYAVTRVDAGPNGEGIYETWQALSAWVEHSKYTPEFCSRQCLEESPNPFNSPPTGFTLNLYEPIRE